MVSLHRVVVSCCKTPNKKFLRAQHSRIQGVDQNPWTPHPWIFHCHSPQFVMWWTHLSLCLSLQFWNLCHTSFGTIIVSESTTKWHSIICMYMMPMMYFHLYVICNRPCLAWESTFIAFCARHQVFFLSLVLLKLRCHPSIRVLNVKFQCNGCVLRAVRNYRDGYQIFWQYPPSHGNKESALKPCLYLSSVWIF